MPTQSKIPRAHANVVVCSPEAVLRARGGKNQCQLYATIIRLYLCCVVKSYPVIKLQFIVASGVGIHRNHAGPIDDNEEDMLWYKGVIRCISYNYYGVFFCNCKIFGFRGGDEHRN